MKPRLFCEETNIYGQPIRSAEKNAAKYLSNHVLVNRVRIEKGLRKLKRSRYLDTLAQDYANEAAQAQSFRRSQHTIDELQNVLGSQRVGQNLCRGHTMIEMHNVSMATAGAPRNNILSRNFVEFGMAIAKAECGKLYMVQFFRGEESERSCASERLHDTTHAQQSDRSNKTY